MNPLSNQWKRPMRERAFTLVEILVVVIILAILVTLLVPVAKSAIERSRNIACVGHLRGMGAGLLQYVADHDGRLIPYASMNSATRFWFDELNPYMGTPDNFSDTRPHAWQLCPSKPVKSDSPGSPNERQVVGYGWNYRQFGNSSGSDPGDGKGNRRLSDVTIPSRTIIIADSLDIPTSVGDIPPISQNRLLYIEARHDKLARRHSGMGNYLLLDGHVTSFKPEEIFLNAGSATASTIPWWGIKQQH